MTERNMIPISDAGNQEHSPQLSQFSIPNSQFELRLPNYEGPLDVLLRLIEERKLEITTVSLASVADQFIAYMADVAQRDPRAISHFLTVAAKLILLKSRTLLPQTAVESEQKEETDDLVNQLRLYQLFKRAAGILKERERAGLRSYPVDPPAIPRPQSRTLPLDNVTLDMLARAMQRVVDRWLPPPLADEVVSRLSFTVNDCIGRIRSALTERPRVKFTDILESMNTRVEIVVMLLALLELLKRYEVRAQQDALFGEIIIEPFPESESPQAEAQSAETEFEG
jgi:segregation and condensation protein A